jgi:hypothetical protein
MNVSNASYCRFENTTRDLHDCAEALDDGATPSTLSEYEAPACRRLIKLCQHIAENYGDLAKATSA